MNLLKKIMTAALAAMIVLAPVATPPAHAGLLSWYTNMLDEEGANYAEARRMYPGLEGEELAKKATELRGRRMEEDALFGKDAPALRARVNEINEAFGNNHGYGNPAPAPRDLAVPGYRADPRIDTGADSPAAIAIREKAAREARETVPATPELDHAMTRNANGPAAPAPVTAPAPAAPAARTEIGGPPTVLVIAAAVTLVGSGLARRYKIKWPGWPRAAK